MIIIPNVAGTQEDYIDRLQDLKSINAVSETTCGEIVQLIEDGDFESVEKLINNLEFANKK